MRNPLDGARAWQQRRAKGDAQNGDPNAPDPTLDPANPAYQGPGGGVFQYFLKVVPTTYATLGGSVIATNQYSVTEHFREPAGPAAAGQLPGLFFFYDLSPIKVKFMEERRSLASFLTSACAIVGGVFTVSGIVEGLLYSGRRAVVRRKSTIGKLGEFGCFLELPVEAESSQPTNQPTDHSPTTAEMKIAG